MNRPIDDRTPRGWRFAQALFLLAGGALVVAIAVGSQRATDLLWQGVIPLLPAIFLLTPSLWRNVCPLATLNELGTLVAPDRRPTRRAVGWATLAGVFWLIAAIVARRPLLDASPASTAALLIGTGVLALAAGSRFARKSGFCNSVCPMLPVERFYGQRPLLRLDNPRCETCDACTLVGCPDLAPTRALAATLRPGREPLRWIASPTGVLSAIFPGLVVAYFTVDPGTSWQATLVWFLLACAASAVVSTALTWLIGGGTRATRLLAGITAATYYLFAAPRWAQFVGLAASSATVTLAFLGLVAFWSWRALRPV